MILIRKAKTDDLKNMAELQQIINSDDYRQLDGNCMVCEVDGIICGFGCSFTYEGSCFLDNIDILEEYRGNGYGSAIVKALLNIADLKGIKWAYMQGGCEDFAVRLGFEKLRETSDSLAIAIQKLYGGRAEADIYSAALENYFCKSCKGTC